MSCDMYYLTEIGHKANLMVPNTKHQQHQHIHQLHSFTMSAKPEFSHHSSGTRRHSSNDVRFGDEDLVVEENGNILEVYEMASYREVFQACCVHTGNDWLRVLVAAFVLAFSLYWMVFGLDLLGEAAKVMTGCAAGALYGGDKNPLSALTSGMLTTILTQSSGTTTAVIVFLAEAHVITVSTGIYMVMGANIGTTVTALLVCLSQMGNRYKIERAFSAASIHGLFNFLTVAILFPLELASGFLSKLTNSIAEGAETGRDESYEGPVKKFVKPLRAKLLQSNKSLIKKVASKEKSCTAFYPVQCDEGVEPSYKTCTPGLVGCVKDTGECPLFFRVSATKTDDQLIGLACFILSVLIILFSLLGLVWALNKLLFGMSTRVVHTLTTCNGYLEFLFGVAFTMLAQSSSVVTSVLVPFAGVGVLRLEQVYPLVLGANMGTALNGTISALDSIGPDALQVALAHLFFNLTGYLIWYPLPHPRKVPFFLARDLGKNAHKWKWFPLCYIILFYAVLPLGLWGLGRMYDIGGGALGAANTISVLLAVGTLALCFWCKFRGGRERYQGMLTELGDRNLDADDFSDSDSSSDFDALMEQESTLFGD